MNKQLRKGSIPESLHVIIDSLGLNDVLLMVRSFGGRKEYIPRKATSSHPIAQKCGIHVLSELVAHYGGTWYSIPKMSRALKETRNREIIRMYESGAKVNDLARDFFVTERQIWNILKQPINPTENPPTTVNKNLQLSF